MKARPLKKINESPSKTENNNHEANESSWAWAYAMGLQYRPVGPRTLNRM